MWETIRHSAAVRFGHRNSGAIIGGAILLRVVALLAVVGGMLAAARWLEGNAGTWVEPALWLGGGLLAVGLAWKAWRFWSL